jgi:hypothetical protein
MDAEENQTQVSLSAHSPWKSLRDSHIPTAPTKAVEKWKNKNGFPTFPLHGLSLLIKFRKEARRRSFAPSPGSLFD